MGPRRLGRPLRNTCEEFAARGTCISGDIRAGCIETQWHRIEQFDAVGVDRNCKAQRSKAASFNWREWWTRRLAQRRTLNARAMCATLAIVATAGDVRAASCRRTLAPRDIDHAEHWRHHPKGRDEHDEVRDEQRSDGSCRAESHELQRMRRHRGTVSPSGRRRDPDRRGSSPRGAAGASGGSGSRPRSTASGNRTGAISRRVPQLCQRARFR